jgi:xanthine dehydrogenase YagS FAD-binding subunit
MQLQAQGTLGGEICRRPRCWYFRNGAGLLADGGQLVAQGASQLHAIFDNAGPAQFVSASRTAPALIALGGSLRVAGPTADDAQLLPVEQLYRTPTHAAQRETCLQPGQFITHIVLPSSAGRCSATYEVRHGAGPDQPLASAAVALQLSAGVVRAASIVLGQVAPTPLVAAATAAWLVGRTVDRETAAAAGRLAVASATPLPQNQYKVQLTAVAVKRALLRATGIDPGGLDEGF